MAWPPITVHPHLFPFLSCCLCEASVHQWFPEIPPAPSHQLLLRDHHILLPTKPSWAAARVGPFRSLKLREPLTSSYILPRLSKRDPWPWGLLVCLLHLLYAALGSENHWQCALPSASSDLPLLKSQLSSLLLQAASFLPCGREWSFPVQERQPSRKSSLDIPALSALPSS